MPADGWTRCLFISMRIRPPRPPPLWSFPPSLLVSPHMVVGTEVEVGTSALVLRRRFVDSLDVLSCIRSAPMGHLFSRARASICTSVRSSIGSTFRNGFLLATGWFAHSPSLLLRLLVSPPPTALAPLLSPLRALCAHTYVCLLPLSLSLLYYVAYRPASSLLYFMRLDVADAVFSLRSLFYRRHPARPRVSVRSASGPVVCAMIIVC